MQIQLKNYRQVMFGGLAFAVLSGATQAGAPAFVDARALAMGGVGVTAARPAAAGFFNPSLLAIKHPEKRGGFGALLPSVTAVASDEEELRDVIDDFEDDFVVPFEAAIDGLDAALTSTVGIPEARAELAQRTRALNDQLQKIDQDQVRVDLGLGASFLVPSDTFGAGLFVSGSARLAAQLNYADAAKLATIESLAASVTNIQDILDQYDPDVADEQLDSSVRAVGSAYSQVGLAISRSFRISGHDYAFGVSPKMVDLRAYDFIGSVEDYETDDLEDTKVSESKFNFDLGVSSFLDAREQVLIGLSIINVLPMDIESEPDFDRVNLDSVVLEPVKIELKPTVAVGLSYRGESYELATDLQLTKTEEVFGEGDTQYWGFGAEYDFAETVQLRGGLRHNLAGSEDPLVTAGLGLNLAGFTFELAALSSLDSNSVGAGAQLGLTF